MTERRSGSDWALDNSKSRPMESRSCQNNVTIGEADIDAQRARRIGLKTIDDRNRSVVRAAS